MNDSSTHLRTVQADAAFAKATALLEGHPTPKDLGRAARHCHEAALLGHIGAQYNLGLMYAKGIGLPQDSDLALIWLQHAAEGGEAKALWAIDALQHAQHSKDAPAAQSRQNSLAVRRD